jgi:hypothetical protein
MNAHPTENSPRYGRVNRDLISRWLRLRPEDDGPFWALNLMKYRAVADYADGRVGRRTGREADDEYAPLESLAAIGARPVFVADVARVTGGDGTVWDRVGIVRYPSRRKFFEMQQRDDFKKKHVHKEAGMEFTIVMSMAPVVPIAGGTAGGEWVELTVTERADAAAANGVVFDVEGVIVGDERTWTRASFRWSDARPEPEGEVTHDDSAYVMLLRPNIDRLLASVRDE